MIRTMDRPPERLHGARVLQFASLARSRPTGKTRHIVNEVEVSDFAAVAIARDDDDPSARTCSTAIEAGTSSPTPGTRISHPLSSKRTSNPASCIYEARRP
jgi:hypothetical protein